MFRIEQQTYIRYLNIKLNVTYSKQNHVYAYHYSKGTIQPTKILHI